MTERIDPDAKVHYTIYNRMGLLLKSLMCVSRVTPAYRIARHQLGSDYKVQHRVFFGEARLSTLGEGEWNFPIETMDLRDLRFVLFSDKHNIHLREGEGKYNSGSSK